VFIVTLSSFPSCWRGCCTGAQGSPGELGQPGQFGAPGDTGATGFPGTLGAIGRQGFTGQQGQIGEVGQPGFKGVAGFTGPSGKLTFFTLVITNNNHNLCSILFTLIIGKYSTEAYC